MEYNWKEGLESFGGSLDYFGESIGLINPLIKKQWPSIENLVRFTKNKRNFYGGSYRSLEALKYLAKGLRKLGYLGKPRPATFVLDEKNVPSHDPRTDNATIASGSMTTKQAVQEMETLVSRGIRTFLITYTTPEMLNEERKGKQIESTWDHFSKQKDFERQVIYLPQRESNKRKDSLFAPLNTEFELCTSLFSVSIGDCIKDYHNFYEGSKTIPLKTISDTITDFKDYFTKYLKPLCYVSQNKIYHLIQAIKKSNDIRIVSPDINGMAGRSFMMRLVNCGFNGKEKSVSMVTSENYGREGSSDIKSDTVVIGQSIDGKDVLTRMIMEEAKKKGIKNRFFIGNADSSIVKYASEVIPVSWSVPGYKGVFGGFGYLGAEIIYNAIISQVAKELDKTEKDLRKEHSEHG